MIAGAKPSVPLFLTLVAQSQFFIKFSWTEPTSLGGIPLTQYRIYGDYGNLGTTNLTKFVQAGVVLPANLIYTQSANLASGQSY